jgi:isopenicillin-N epimerase
MSGVKLPITAIAHALAKINAGRDEADRALLCVDGVHGFGIDPISVADFGADFFIAGTHKWVFGPRGTGLVWGTEAAWKNIVPTIPGFEMPTFVAWLKGEEAQNVPGGLFHSPGGFHSFEHRWSVPAAFDFQNGIGREAIADRIHALNRQLKEGLAKMPKVELFTPMSDELSAGITCFMIEGRSPKEVVEQLMHKKIMATTTPYKNTYARLAPGLLNTPAEVDTALAEIRSLAG